MGGAAGGALGGPMDTAAGGTNADDGDILNITERLLDMWTLAQPAAAVTGGRSEAR